MKKNEKKGKNTQTHRKKKREKEGVWGEETIPERAAGVDRADAVEPFAVAAAEGAGLEDTVALTGFDCRSKKGSGGGRKAQTAEGRKEGRKKKKRTKKGKREGRSSEGEVNQQGREE